MYEYNPHRQNLHIPQHHAPRQHPHHPHHLSRHDMHEVYTISNPMMFHHADMGNKHSRGVPTQLPSVTMQLNDTYSDSSPSEHTNGVLDHKDVNHSIFGRFQGKYIINLVLFIVVTVIISGVEFGFLPHVKQSYICKDPKLSYKYNGDTIRPSVLGIVCVLLPLTTFFCVEWIRQDIRDLKVIFSLVWRWCKYLFIGNIVLNLFITEIIKSAFGEPRPHFFDTCSPNATDCKLGEIVENYHCTNTIYSKMIVRDSSRSFTSGHASLAMFTSLYCAAYIYYRFKSSTFEFGILCKPFTMAVVMAWGPYCGLSRITDHRHHWWDVLAGSFIGVVTALFTIFALAKKFRDVEKSRPSLSSTKLCDDNKDEQV